MYRNCDVTVTIVSYEGVYSNETLPSFCIKKINN
nr:MAG TPA: hypothetical protein [Caudoviricetes sp.]